THAPIATALPCTSVGAGVAPDAIVRRGHATLSMESDASHHSAPYVTTSWPATGALPWNAANVSPTASAACVSGTPPKAAAAWPCCHVLPSALARKTNAVTVPSLA